jgi:hypothetical protein
MWNYGNYNWNYIVIIIVNYTGNYSHYLRIYTGIIAILWELILGNCVGNCIGNYCHYIKIGNLIGNGIGNYGQNIRNSS